MEFLDGLKTELINVIRELYNNFSIYNYLLMYYTLWFYVYLIGDVIINLYYDGIYKTYELVDPCKDLNFKCLDPYIDYMIVDSMEVRIGFWLLHDMFNAVMNGGSIIPIIHVTPDKLREYIDDINDEGALIYQYTDDENTHSSLLFKMKNPDSTYSYFNYDCVRRYNYGHMNQDIFVYYKDEDKDITVTTDKLNLVNFLTKRIGLLLFKQTPVPGIIKNPEKYHNVIYSKFQKFVGGAIRNLVLVILLIAIIVVIVIIIHNKYFKQEPMRNRVLKK